jgi:hypothetical protein
MFWLYNSHHQANIKHRLGNMVISMTTLSTFKFLIESTFIPVPYLFYEIT